MNNAISFLPPVNSFNEICNVIPATPIAFACDVSDPTKHAFYVFRDGRWTPQSIVLLEEEIAIRLGDQVNLVKADGSKSDAVLTYVQGKVIVHEIHGV